MKAMWLAFGAVFLAELGDKTQLAILAMKSKGYSGMGPRIWVLATYYWGAPALCVSQACTIFGGCQTA